MTKFPNYAGWLDWRGITLSKMENNESGQPNGPITTLTFSLMNAVQVPLYLILYSYDRNRSSFHNVCTKTHKAMNSDVYCNTPQSGTFQIGPVIYTRISKWLSSTYAYPPTFKGVLRRNVSFIFKLYIYLPVLVLRFSQ